MDEQFSKELEEMGHVKVTSSRCTARYKNEPQRVSGPPNLPVWCDLPAGHEGPHRHVTGHRSFIMVRAHLIEMVPLPEVCQSCGTVWPCEEARKLTHAYSLGLAKGRKEGEPRGRGEGIADFICYLIDNHETETITEERLQQIYTAFIKADAIRQAAQGGDDKNHTEDVRGMVQTADRTAGGECK